MIINDKVIKDLKKSIESLEREIKKTHEKTKDELQASIDYTKEKLSWIVCSVAIIYIYVLGLVAIRILT